MKPAFFAVATVAAAIMVHAAPSPAAATELQAKSAETQSDEMSAARRRPSAGPVYVDGLTGEIVNPYRPRYIAPSHDFVGGPDGYPGEYAMRRAAGQCVMDFGYGRWRAC